MKINSPLFFPFIIAATLLILVLAPEPSFGAGSPDDQLHGEKFQFETLSSGLQTTQVQVSFTGAPEDLVDLPRRLSRYFWIAGFRDGDVTITLDDATWFVKDEKTEEIHGPYGIDEGEEWGGFPETLNRVRATYQDAFRSAGLYRGQVELARYKSIAGENEERRLGVIYINSAVLTINLGTEPDLPTVADSYTQRFLENNVVNKEQVPLVLREFEDTQKDMELDAWNRMLTNAEKRGPILYAELPRSGLYRITPEEIRAAGVDPEIYDTSTIRLYAGQRELSFFQNDVRDDRLVGDSSLFFYVPEELEYRKPYIPIWMFVEDEENTNRQTSLIPQGSFDADAVKNVSYDLEIFQPNHYNHGYPMKSPHSKWGTTEMVGVDYEEYDFRISEPSDTGLAEIEITAVTLRNSHTANYSAFINNKEIGVGKVLGRRISEETFAFDANLLRKGINTLAIRNNEPENGGSTSLGVLTASFAIPLRSNDLDPNTKGRIVFENEGNRSVTFPQIGEHGRDHFLVDVTDPFQPVFQNLRPAAVGDSRVVGANIGGTKNSVDLIYTIAGAAFRPDFSQRSAPTVYTEKKPTEYLIIYHDKFKDTVQDLIDYRMKTREVAAYPVSEVYAAYSGGFLSYEAIHDFISHSFRKRTDRHLKEVLLIGEGSEYWWERRMAKRDVSENMMPVFGFADSSKSIRGDDGYAQIIGNAGIPDVEIGRYSLSTNEELELVIQKLINYETNPPVGNWMNRHLIVTDDEPEFLRVGKEIINKSFEGANIPDILALQWLPYEDYYRGRWRKRSVVATDRVIEEWNEGASTITYLGHGGPNLWSGERILHIRDIDRINTNGKLPILAAGSCDTGWIDYPVDPVKTSLAEYMVKSPEGGVIGAYIPIFGTSSYMHNFLLTEYYRGMFGQPEADLGELTMYSKINFLLYNQNLTVPEQFILMGDPALRPAVGGDDLDIRVSPKEMATVTEGSIRFSGYTDQIANGMADIVLLNPEWEPVFKKRTSITNGQLDGRLDIPKILDPGSYRLIITAQNTFEGVFLKASEKITVQEPKVDVEWTTDPSSDKPLQAGTPITISYNVSNESEFALTRATIEIWDGERDEKIATHPVRLPSGERLSRSFDIAVPEGVNSFRGKLYLKENEDPESTQVVLAEERIVIRGIPSGENRLAAGYLGFSLAELEITQVDNQTTAFNLPLYRLADINFDNLEAALLKDSSEGEQVGEKISLEALTNNESNDYTITTDKTFNSGDQPFVLEILAPSSADPKTSRTIQYLPFVYDFAQGPDLEIVDDSLILEELNPKGGKTLFLRYRIRNIGKKPITNINNQLYVGEPWNSENLAEVAVPWAQNNLIKRLAPGEETEVRLRWDHSGPNGGQYKLFATTSSSSSEREADLSNNVESIQITLRPSPNLVLNKSGFTASKQNIEPYDRILISVPFENQSNEDFIRPFRVTAYAESFLGNRRMIQRQFYPGLSAGSSGTFQFEWKVKPGEHEVFVDVNEDREYLESNFGDNDGLLSFRYIFDGKQLVRDKVYWDYEDLLEYSQTDGVMRFPGDHFVVRERPNSPPVNLPFTPDQVISGELGEGLKQDNLFGSYREDEIVQVFNELPEEITFRWDLPEDDGTTIYDLYVSHLGNRDPEKMTGHFKYRLGDQEWDQLNGGGSGNNDYLGRLDTYNDVFDLSLDDAGYPASNHIWTLNARPVHGVIEAPLVYTESFPRGRALISGKAEGLSEIQLQVRYGTGDHTDINWTSWSDVDSGDTLPEPPQQGGIFQWRIRLAIFDDNIPELHGVRFELLPSVYTDNQEIAESTIEQEILGN